MKGLLCLQNNKSKLSALSWLRNHYILTSMLALVMATMLFPLLSGFHKVSAANFPISAFALYGQQTYGAPNSWFTDLPYAGTSIHSVYRWRVYTNNIPTQNAGRYANVSISGFINVPIDFITNLDQGYTITDCFIGNFSASISDIHTSWTLNPASQNTPPQIIYAADATLDFGTNNVSGNLYCTLSSNNGVYFLQHSTTGVGTVSFGTTNFNVNFANTLSDELLQTQVNQNQTIINQNQTIINQDSQDREDLQDEADNASDASDDLSDDVTNASSSLLVIIGNFVNIVLNPPQSDCNITLDVGNANFGQADLCRLSLPQPLAVLGTLFILGFIITFTVSLIMTFLSLLKGATQG